MRVVQMAGKHVLLLIALTYLLTVCGGAAREPRAEVDCWGSLMELRSCTNEIMQYLVKGEADIGPHCCRAITVITHNCWPAVLASLGFTDHEAYILRGYCDAAPAFTPALAPAIP
ncbi:egg cell-secreted protein 1.4-like [Neltuma alba]|uniref:egg cell-secreted protein 1.4-like n=1 Tax=Neltuma alba TaxID=207710 RepID=UPI0010A53455|nr:egg cell-secreted protein 1.4-like [Prosopis alba]